MNFYNLFDCDYLKKLVNTQTQNNQTIKVAKPKLREHEIVVTQSCLEKNNTNYHIAMPYSGLSLTDLDIGLRINKNIVYTPAF